MLGLGVAAMVVGTDGEVAVMAIDAGGSHC